ncbi:hypothetical protein PCE1_000392 [Barthelona sp. PCE]
MFSGASWLFIVQLISRTTSFLLNIATTRLVLPDSYGIFTMTISLQLHLCMMLGAEPFRRTFLKTSTSDDDNLKSDEPAMSWRGNKDIAWLAVLVGGIILFLVDTWNIIHKPYLRVPILLFSVGIFLQILAEPMYILQTSSFTYKQRALIEGLGSVARSFTVMLCLILFHQTKMEQIIGYCYGEVVFGIIYFLGFYYTSFKGVQHEQKNVSPLRILLPSKHIFSKQTLKHSKLWLTFLWQNVQKLFMTHGEKLLCVLLLSDTQMGYLAFIMNFGSMLNRLVLRIWEEILFNHFAVRKKEKNSAYVLGSILMSVVLISYLIAFSLRMCFHDFVTLVYGSTWIKPEVSELYTVFSLFMFFSVVNGSFEALAHSVSCERDLKKQNIILLVLGIVYFVSTFIFTPFFGVKTFIFVNAFQMAARLLLSLAFITRNSDVSFYKSSRTVIPVLIVIAGIYSLLMIIVKSFCTSIVFRMCGFGVVGGILAITLLYTFIRYQGFRQCFSPMLEVLGIQKKKEKSM